MTKQTWTAAVSALLFVVSAAIIAMVPVPYVTYAPGRTVDLFAMVDGRPVVAIDGVASHPTTGELRITTVSVTRPDAGISLPEALLAWWSPDREVHPREAVYPAGTRATDVRARDADLMTSAKTDAAAAGLREAGVEVRQTPMVKKVASQGPSMDLLRPGDFVTSVDGAPTPTKEAVERAIQAHQVGESVTFGILRDQVPQVVTVETVASNVQAGVPVVGVTFVTGFNHAPRVSIGVDDDIGGSSAGLMMALAVFDRVSPDDLVRGRAVAGTGEIDGLGNVRPVSGVHEKLTAAQRAAATVFLLPAANCADVSPGAPLRLVPVSTVDEAVHALDALADPTTADLVKGCS